MYAQVHLKTTAPLLHPLIQRSGKLSQAWHSSQSVVMLRFAAHFCRVNCRALARARHRNAKYVEH